MACIARADSHWSRNLVRCDTTYTKSTSVVCQYTAHGGRSTPLPALHLEGNKIACQIIEIKNRKLIENLKHLLAEV